MLRARVMKDRIAAQNILYFVLVTFFLASPTSSIASRHSELPTAIARCSDKLLARESVDQDSNTVEYKLGQAVNAAYGVSQGGPRFFEAIDSQLRGDPGYVVPLLKQALRRLPYLTSTEFNIMVSGGVADPWPPLLTAFAYEHGLKINIIQFSGGLGKQVGRVRRELPRFPNEVQSIIRQFPSIFLDDTYSAGNTSDRIRTAISQVGGHLEGVFVLVDAGKGDASSLYKTARPTHANQSLRNFPIQPVSWRWQSQSATSLAITSNLLFGPQDAQPRRQAHTLLKELNRMHAQVRIDDIGIHSSQIAAIRQAYPQIEFLTPDEPVDVAIGNWGENFLGPEESAEMTSHRPLSRPNSATRTLELPRPAPEGDHVMSESNLAPTFYLDRLSEAGVLIPEFQTETPSQKPKQGQVRTFDLR